MPFGAAVAAVEAVFRLRDEISPQLATLEANMQATGKRWQKIVERRAQLAEGLRRMRPESARIFRVDSIEKILRPGELAPLVADGSVDHQLDEIEEQIEQTLRATRGRVRA